MRVEAATVRRAMEGDRPAFDSIVRAYGEGLYAFCLAQAREREEAEDAVQEIFVKAFVGLKDLRECERFESWLFAIARRVLASRGKARARDPARMDIDPDELAAEEKAEGEADAAILGALFAALNPEQALAVALRYGAELSVRETALACGVAESVAKSRLHEALSRMRGTRMRATSSRSARLGLRDEALSGFRIPIGLKERIMESIETLRLGARVVERMAIYDQTRLARLAASGEKMDETVLEAIGKIDGGPEFLRRTGARLGVREFAAVLNNASREAEKRIVEELERSDPEIAELLKADMFVFEDFCLCDGPSIELLLRKLGPALFAQGLSACENRERNLILEIMAPATRTELSGLLRDASTSPKLAQAAQEEAIAFMRNLEAEGRVRVVRGEEAGSLGARIVIAAGGGAL
jgi:RNA polymerase sigma factor (sigma-70 family)